MRLRALLATCVIGCSALAVVIVVTQLVFVSRGATAPSPSSPVIGAAAPPIVPPSSSVAIGVAAPAILLPSTAGPVVSPTSLRGRVYVVVFWASWAVPSHTELAMLEGLHRALAVRGFTAVGVSEDSSIANVTRFLSGAPVSFPIVHDAGGVVAGRYHPTGMPMAYIVDRAGIVRFVHRGYRPSDAPAIEAEIRVLL